MIPTLIVRVLQLIFGAIVLGISIKAIQWQWTGAAPATTSYSAFAGAFGIVAALVGAAAVKIERIPGLIVAGIDGLAALLMLAGGIVGIHSGPS